MSGYILETKKLGISFGGLTAAQDVDLRIPKEGIYGLIGPNGAGKTTIFNLLTNVYQPTRGKVLLDGQDLTGLGPDKICRLGLARTFQNIRLFNNMTVVRNVMVGLQNRPEYACSVIESVLRLPRHRRVEGQMRQRAKDLLRIFGLEEDRNALACSLPYGKQRKLEIARALATDPKVLLLDEPAAGMNPHETEDLANTIRQIRDDFGMTILLIEHDMRFVADLCDQVTVLNFGTVLAQGSTQTVLQDPAVIKAYIGG